MQALKNISVCAILLILFSVIANAQTQAPIVVTAQPPTINAGESSVVSTVISGIGADGNPFSIALPPVTVTPTATSPYSVTIGSVTGSTVITVNEPPPPPPPPPPSGDWPAPGTWMAVPNSRLDQSGQLPVPKPLGSSGYPAIESAWNSSCYDSSRDRMIVTGGGHGDYAGNELYEFPLTTRAWRRTWGPTPNDQIQPPPAAMNPTPPQTYLNGDPRQVHTYSGLLCFGDTLWRHGGSVWSGSGGFTQDTWTFDLAHDATWSWISELSNFGGAQVPTCVVDEKTAHIFCHQYAFLWEVDPVAKTATKRSTQSAGYSPSAAAAIDQATRRFVFIGDKSGQSTAAVYWYQLDQTGLVTLHINQPTTGDTGILTDPVNGHTRPGLAWDSRAQRLTAWNGGPFLYTLDTNTWVWTKHTMAAENAPGGTISGGVYARFTYLPKYDAFLLLNGIDAPVYLARIDDAPVLEQPKPPDTPTSTQIALPTDGTWKALKLADVTYAKGSLPGSLKHVSPGYNPVDHRLYFTAGDYSSTPGTSSYRQETWSLSIADRATSTDPTAGWRKEYDYCGSGLQPKWPDYGGFHYDVKRAVFWWVAGVSEVNTSAPCVAETSDKTDNAGFSAGHVMTYDPAAKRWANAGLLGPAFTRVWDTVYDAGNDTLVTVLQGSSAGDVSLQIFDPKTGMWTKKQVFAQPKMSKTLYGLKGYGALDPVTRTLYYIEAYYGHLMSVDLAAQTVTDLGPVPALAEDGKTPVVMDSGRQPKVVWDGKRKLVYWHNHQVGQFFAYHSDTRQWETLSTKSSIPGIEACNATVMVYDPGQDALIAWGDVWADPGTPQANARPYMFVYRHK